MCEIYFKIIKNCKNVKVVRGQTSRFKTVEIHKPDPKSWKKNLEGLDN